MINFIRLFCIFLLSATIAGASVCPPIGQPSRFNPGDTMKTLTDWNPTVVGVYTWVNTNIADTLNKLTAKGDMYVYDGSVLQKRAVGTNGQLLVSRPTDPFGVAWETYTGEDPRTTKGDVTVYNGAGLVERLPVGTDGQVLTVSANTAAWTDVVTNPFPRGAIASWSPAAAGTSTIPTGWALCDGTNSTPNLIGRFVIGAKPTGSSSSASIGGFGAYTADTANGANTHIHGSVLATGITTGPGTNVAVVLNAVGSGIASNQDIHTHGISSVTRAIATRSGEPADFALVYIMKL